MFVLALLAVSNFDSIAALESWMVLSGDGGGMIAVGALGYTALKASSAGHYLRVLLLLLSSFAVEGGVVYTLMTMLASVPRARQCAIIITAVHCVVILPLSLFGVVWYRAMRKVGSVTTCDSPHLYLNMRHHPFYLLV